MPDLGLVPTDDLLAELESRADAGVVILQEERRQDCSKRRFRWWGGLAAALGLTLLFQQEAPDIEEDAEEAED